MTSEYRGPEELLARTSNFVEDHRNLYVSSGGVNGHIVRFDHVGVDGYLPSLLLQTVGRKTGRLSIVPLIYGCHGGEWVVVGSKGGAPENPAWFLNLQERETAVFQIGAQAFTATWRLLNGAEYDAAWDYMQGMYPPYRDYRNAVTTRTIPLVKLRPIAAAPLLRMP